MPTPGGLDLTLMLLLGLASSLHCATMCGPIIVVASAPLAGVAPGSAGARPAVLRLLGWQAAYHLGRGATYALLGALLAGAGGLVTAAAGGRLLGGVLQIGLGLAIVVAGVWQLRRGKSALFAGKGGSGGGGLLATVLRRLVTSRRGLGMLGLGLFTGLLPCGVLYAALARSVAAPSVPDGAGLMLAFWLGTVPLLLVLGLASSQLVRAAGRFAPAFIFIAMLATGGWLTYKGIRNVTAPPRSAHLLPRGDGRPALPLPEAARES
jgi:sulfite exporter TauE/SafE